ncbi:MAG: archaeosine biosynthesis radical SAM protein RaSEA [Methanomassiliicoccales archaeon]|nr:archaeosine biosynthesis radical SAM protein RaSEA [Methanomassiliicoccales archaeon]
MATQDRRDMPQAIWKEEDLVGGRKVRALVVILRTVGCWWSRKKGCLMCGYNQAASEAGIGEPELMRQLDVARARLDGEEMVKIYTSGSFLDEREVPKAVRDRVFQDFSSCSTILFESRPEFVTEESLVSLPAEKVEVALGLESGNDLVLRECINKGFRVQDYIRAASLIKQRGMRVRTYLLLKPPYLTERQALEDTVASIRLASAYSDSVSVNPVNVQRDTIVESLFRRGDYRPPWLWSLVEALRTRRELGGVRVFSSPSGAGTPRGAHNCGKCDAAVIAAVERFSFSQDLQDLEGLECECRARWRAQLELQDHMRTSVDLDRHLADDLGLD